MMINNFKSRRIFFVKDSIRFRVTAILMALIMTYIVIPSDLWAFGIENTEVVPRMIEPYNDPTVSHTAGVGTESEDKYIIREEVERRSETTRQYLMSDGSIMVQEYGFPVNYIDGEDYKELDNRLIKTAATRKNAGFYRNAAGYYDVKISEKIDGENNHITVAKDGYSIAMGLKSSETAPIKESMAQVASNQIKAAAKIKEGTDYSLIKTKKPIISEKIRSEVLFDNVFEDTSFEYELMPTGVKENIIVHQRQDNYDYEFSLLAEGMQSIQEGKSVLFVNVAGETIFRMPAMYMTDAAGAYSEEVFYTLTGSAGNYNLKITADKNWINAEERVFPVVIDPIIDTWTTSTASGWTLKHDGTKMGAVDGRVNVSTSSYAAVRFPIPESIGNMTLSYGHAKMHVQSSGTIISSGLDYKIYAAEALTSFSDVQTLQDLKLEDTYVWGGTAKSARQHWDNFFFSGNSVKNNEIIFIYKHTSNSGITGGVSINASERLPQLTLYYQNIQGVSEYPTETFEVSGATAHVNMVNRKLSVAIDGLSVNTAYLPLQVDLMYNQDYNAVFHELGITNYFGNHIKSNFQQYVKSSANGDIYYHIGADGSVNTYLKDKGSDGIYISEKTNLSLHIIGRKATLFDDVGNEMEFEDGRLKCIRSENYLLGEIRVNYEQTGGMNTDKIDCIQFYRANSQIPANEIKFFYNSANQVDGIDSYCRDENNNLQLLGSKTLSYSGNNLVYVRNSLQAIRLTLEYSNGNLSALRSSSGAGYHFDYENNFVNCVTYTQGVSSVKEYDKVTFSNAKNTVSANYFSDGIFIGNRNTATDIQKRMISEWYSDVAGNYTVVTDSLWRSSGNDPFWPNYTRSLYSYEEKLNTNFDDAFTLSGNGSKSSTLASAVEYKAGNRYVLGFRMEANSATDITVMVGSQTKRIQTAGATNSYITIPFSRIASGTQIKFLNNIGLNVQIHHVSFAAVTQVNQYKSLSGVMYAYRIYKDEVIDTDRTTLTEYLENRGIGRIEERDNENGGVLKTKTFSYNEDPSSRVGRLSNITETEGNKTTTTTITSSNTADSETVTISTTKNYTTLRTIETYETGFNLI